MRAEALEGRALPEAAELASVCADPPALDVYLRRHWRIVPDPEEYEFVRSPAVQFQLAQQNGFFIGDCDDAATLAACVMGALGWPCSLIAGREAGKFEFSHTWLRCFVGGGRPWPAFVYDIDPIVPVEKMPVAGTFEELLEVPILEA